MKLEDIGFYTLSNYRASQSSETSPYWRCELVLTDRCNFKCPYCRGLIEDCKKDLPQDYAEKIVNYWADNNLQNIRFSGGEPTLYSGLLKLVILSKERGIKRIALSTNGSAKFEVYKELFEAGVNDFSVSLDSCCANFGKIMAGNINLQWQEIIDNIKKLSKLTYVTVGIVLTDTNISQVENIVNFAHGLGVSDIRVITAAQQNKDIEDLKNLHENILNSHPILKYRVNNYKNGKSIRGLKNTDSHKCPLVLDDMAISGKYHFPCIIYMREHGKAVGSTDDLNMIRKDRINWYKEHNTHEDPICKSNCLDVCIQYNNTHEKYKSSQDVPR